MNDVLITDDEICIICNKKIICWIFDDEKKCEDCY